MRVIDQLWTWRKGSRGGGYTKFLLFILSFMDIHLIKVPTGAHVPRHTDVVPGYKHHRLNVVLRKPLEGGQLKSWKALSTWGRFTWFRPDLYEHHVTEVTSGSLLILSIGWVFENPDLRIKK